MGSNLWDDIKKTVKDGVSLAAEKTEEYTKIGKIKVDILNINRNLDKNFQELGREAFDHISSASRSSINKNEKVQELIEQIKSQQAAIESKEAEIEEIKEAAKDSNETEAQEAKPEPSKPDEKKKEA